MHFANWDIWTNYIIVFPCEERYVIEFILESFLP